MIMSPHRRSINWWGKAAGLATQCTGHWQSEQYWTDSGLAPSLRCRTAVALRLRYAVVLQENG